MSAKRANVRSRHRPVLETCPSETARHSCRSKVKAIRPGGVAAVVNPTTGQWHNDGVAAASSDGGGPLVVGGPRQF